MSVVVILVPTLLSCTDGLQIVGQCAAGTVDPADTHASQRAQAAQRAWDRRSGWALGFQDNRVAAWLDGQMRAVDLR